MSLILYSLLTSVSMAASYSSVWTYLNTLAHVLLGKCLSFVVSINSFSVCVALREQLLEVCFLLPPHGFQKSSSGVCLGDWQSPLLPKPSCWPSSIIVVIITMYSIILPWTTVHKKFFLQRLIISLVNNSKRRIIGSKVSNPLSFFLLLNYNPKELCSLQVFQQAKNLLMNFIKKY